MACAEQAIVGMEVDSEGEDGGADREDPSEDEDDEEGEDDGASGGDEGPDVEDERWKRGEDDDQGHEERMDGCEWKKRRMLCES
jgi:hypothetical protein